MGGGAAGAAARRRARARAESIKERWRAVREMLTAQERGAVLYERDGHTMLQPVAELILVVEPFQPMQALFALRQLAEERLAAAAAAAVAAIGTDAPSAADKEIVKMKRQLDQLRDDTEHNSQVEQDLLGGLGTFENEAQYRKYHDLRRQWSEAKKLPGDLRTVSGEAAASLIDDKIDTLWTELSMLKAATKYGGELQDLLKFRENTRLVDPSVMKHFEELAGRRNKLVKWSKSTGHNSALGSASMAGGLSVSPGGRGVGRGGMGTPEPASWRVCRWRRRVGAKHTHAYAYAFCAGLGHRGNGELSGRPRAWQRRGAARADDRRCTQGRKLWRRKAHAAWQRTGPSTNWLGSQHG